MLPSRIYLVGMPGCGKSTLAKSLANKLAYHFIDTDQLIWQTTQMPISTIFEQHGEDFFREKEREILHTTFKMTRIVVATGGGTPCYFDNIEQINQHGLAVFINLPIAILANRIEQQQQQRPLLNTQNAQELIDKLKNLYQQRYDFYDKAELSVSGAELNADYIYNKIQHYLREYN